MSLARLAVGRLLGVPGVSTFRGVPYASARRFQPPESVTAWGDLREAREHGPIAPQPAAIPGIAVPGMAVPGAAMAGLKQDEACLTLTIATPGLPAADAQGETGWPVIVFLHGGMYQVGAGSLEVHDPALLAGGGECVVVSLNYRLGALGFLHLPGVAEGNMGLLDIIAGLRWVRDHIAAFGGDPGNVTLMGHDAGAHAALCLLTMWESQGLFQRAIVQSVPLMMAPHSREVALARAEALVEAAGCAPGALAGLPVARLLEAQGQVARAVARFADMTAPFLPVFDGLADPRRFCTAAAASAAARGVDVVIGTTREEMHGVLLADPAVAPSADLVATRFAEITGAEEAMELYSRRRLGASPADLLGDLMTDHLFTFPALAFADGVTAAGGRAWVYQFDWAPPGSRLRAAHGIDVTFSFGTMHRAEGLHSGGDTAEMASLSAAMRAAWTEFAQTGEPEAPGLPWPQYRAQQRMTMRFGRVLGPVGDLAGAVWRGGVGG